MPAQQSSQLNENTPLPLRFVVAALGVAIGSIVPAAVGWTLMSANLESAKADIALIKTDRTESMRLWHQDRADNAAFQARVLTELENIKNFELKHDRQGD